MRTLNFLTIVLLTLLLQSYATRAQAAVNIQHWITSNGSEVYFVENHDLPIVDVSVNFSAGSAYDTLHTAGLAALTHHLMALGAGGLDEEILTNRFADIGAVLGGGFDADRASFKMRVMTGEYQKALETFCLILHKPNFKKSVLEREKTRIVAGIQEAETEPGSIAQKAFMQAVYGVHPYSQDGSGEVSTIPPIQVSTVQQFYQKHYTAKSAVIALMGDMTSEQAKRMAEQLSSGLPLNKVDPIPPVLSYPSHAIEQHIPHPATQSHILLGYPGVKRGDPDFFALYVGNYILGGGFVSRLTEEVREKRGLAYSVYSLFIPMAELGTFQIGLQTKKNQSAEALALVRKTVKDFIELGVTEGELLMAKQNITGGFPLRIDSNSKILEYLSVIGFYKLPLNYLETFSSQVDSVTMVQIQDAFKRRIKPDSMVTIVVGE